MKYDEVESVDIWACAFDVDLDRWEGSIVRLKQEPILGRIIDGYFYPYKKNIASGLQKNGVRKSARKFANTYDECVSIYNGLITKKIEKLQAAINDLEYLKINK